MLMPLLAESYASQSDGIVERVSEGLVEKRYSLIGDDGFGEDLVDIRILSSISSDAFANLIGRSTEIGMSSTRITPDVAAKLESTGSGRMDSPRNEHIVALDSIVVVTHPNNTIKALKMSDLQGIYSGKISNWSEVGGPDAPITVVNRMSGAATRAVFEDRVFQDAARGAPAKEKIVDSYEDVANYVREDENAIAYVPFAYQLGAKPLPLENACGIVMQPDAFSARTEEYALGRFLYLYSRQDTATPEVRKFLDFATSDQADFVVRKSGFIDLGVERMSQDFSSFRARQLLSGDASDFEAGVMRDMLSDMMNYDRLSSTFRFETGSDQLDERGALNLKRLVSYAEGLPEGSELVFVGFTDPVGSFKSNMRLAEKRSDKVAQEFRRLGLGSVNGIKISTAGYGPIAPTACNTEDEGRRINRRVEVWIKAPNAS